MLNAIDKKVLSFGLWFGDTIVKALEEAIPSFRDKDENLLGLKDYYLERFNLSKKEQLKRTMKFGVRVYFSLVFWIFFGYTIWGFIFSGFNMDVLWGFLVFSAILLFFCVMVAFWVSYRD